MRSRQRIISTVTLLNILSYSQNYIHNLLHTPPYSLDTGVYGFSFNFQAILHFIFINVTIAIL